MRKKYLLGERHGSGKWEEQTDIWDVPKMREKGKAIPHEREDRLGLFDSRRDPMNQPLESSHAYLIGASLAAQSYLNDLCSDRTDLNLDIDVARSSVLGLIDEAKGWTNEIIHQAKVYREFVAKGDRRRPIFVALKAIGIVFPGLRRLYRFSRKYQTVYKPEAVALNRLLDDMKFAVVSAIFEQGNPAADQWAELARLRIARIDQARAFIPLLVAELIEVAKIDDPAEIAAINAAAARDTDAFQAAETINASNPVRERFMIDNVRAAARPLLVQVGEEHVDRLAQAVGDSVPIHAAETGGLAARTQQPPP